MFVSPENIIMSKLTEKWELDHYFSLTTRIFKKFCSIFSMLSYEFVM